MINRVVLVGRLTRDPEIRVSQNNVSIGNFTLAVNRPFTDQNGERQADFINCVAFKKQAENAQKFLGKGSLVGVTGRLQSRSYDNKEGQRVFVTEVLCDNIVFLDSKQQNQENRQTDNNQQTQQYNQPQVRNGQQENPFASGSVELLPDDLPF